MDELKNVTTENIKDKLYDCLQSTFETIEVVKKDLSQIYEGVANDLDIMRANNSDYTKGVQEGLNSIGREVEKAYNKGLEDAWKLARKIFTFNNNKMEEIFGVAGKRSVFDDLSPQEAIAKLEAYEKEQNEIKVGDVVFNKDTNEHCVITHIEGKLVVYCLYDDGSCGTSNIKECEKTGKHIDIQSALEQIGGSDV